MSDDEFCSCGHPSAEESQIATDILVAAIDAAAVVCGQSDFMAHKQKAMDFLEGYWDAFKMDGTEGRLPKFPIEPKEFR